MTPEAMNVLVLGANYAPESTGTAPYTTAVSRALRDVGARVRVVTTYPHYPEWRVRDGYSGWSRTEDDDGVRLRRVRHFVPRSPSNLRRLLAETTLGARYVLADWGRADLVLMVSPSMFASALAMVRVRVQKMVGRPAPRTAVWVQDLYSRGMEETGSGSQAAGRLVALVESWLLRRADGVVTIHDRFRDVVVETLGVARERAVVVRNWTHLRPTGEVDVRGVRAAHGWADDETVVLHAGNQGLKQGLENVVHAARAARERGHRMRFVLLGDGNQRPRLEALDASDPVVQFLDPLPDAEFRAALRAADILLVNERPGVSDMSVPSKLTSYFDAGRPVVAATGARSTTAFELERSGGGVRVDPGAPHRLVDILEDVAADDDARTRMAAAGLRYRQRELSEAQAVGAMLEALLGIARPPTTQKGPR